jgi:hypothetical protein
MATLYLDLQIVATNYLPEAGKGFKAWLVDDYYEGSGYALRMKKILESRTHSKAG